MRFLPVTIYHNCDVDNELVNVSKSSGDAILWLNPHPYDVTIQFRNGPFSSQKFIVPAAGAISSGPVSDSAQVEQTYDYEISNMAMQMASDPGIKIKP
jgi:hypothetical protein